MSELLLGCGFQRKKLLTPPSRPADWEDVFTVDQNSQCKPDIVCNLDSSRFRVWRVQDWNEKAMRCVDTDNQRMKENYFTEVHAYEILEHLGEQGDANSFFHTFTNIYRVLVPGGFLCGTVPSRYSNWLWGDPGHRRAILKESLSFLDQTGYAQLGHTAYSDYRNIYQGDFNLIMSEDDKTFHKFILQAVKPSRLEKTFK
jgi:hypothetical protein